MLDIVIYEIDKVRIRSKEPLVEIPESHEKNLFESLKKIVVEKANLESLFKEKNPNFEPGSVEDYYNKFSVLKL